MENKALIAFIFGAAAGSIVTYFLVKNQFAEKCENEIQIARDYYKSLEKDLDVEKDVKDLEDISKVKKGPSFDIFSDKYKKVDEEPKVSEDEVDYQQIIHNLNYGKYFEKEGEQAPVEESDEPFVISDEEWEEVNGKDKVTLTFYEDDEVLCDDCDNPIEAGIDLFGEDNLDRFGEYEEGVMYIRNNKTGCDYMIILEHCSYASIYGED